MPDEKYISVPSGMQQRPQWLNWEEGTKKPTPGIRGRLLTFDEACARDLDHIGYAFQDDDPYCGIDIDEMTPLAAQLLQLARSYGAYVERSPSGRGWHVIGRGVVGRGIGQFEGVEAYSRDRYFTVTGRGEGDAEVDINPLVRIVLAARIDAGLEPPSEIPGSADFEVVEEVRAALEQLGWPRQQLHNGLSVRCPWWRSHTKDTGPSSTMLLENGFKCLHAHCEDKTLDDVIQWLDLVMGVELPSQMVSPDVFEDLPELFPVAPAVEGVAILDKEFDPLEFVAEDMIVEGLNLIGSAPKIGKTWMLYQLIISSGLARPFWGCATTRRPILALMLEDSERSTQSRLRNTARYMGVSDAELAIAVELVKWHWEWPPAEHGGVKAVDTWLTENPGGAVIVDTLPILLGVGADQRKQGAYRADYAEIRRISQLARKHRACIVGTWHNRKAAGSDPLALISGSFGVSAGVDTSTVFDVQRTARQGLLHISGRDIIDRDLAIKRGDDNPLWVVDETKEDVARWPRGEQERTVLKVLRATEGACTAREISEQVGLAKPHVTTVLTRLVQHGWARRESRGRYVDIPLLPEGDVVKLFGDLEEPISLSDMLS